MVSSRSITQRSSRNPSVRPQLPDGLRVLANVIVVGASIGFSQAIASDPQIDAASQPGTVLVAESVRPLMALIRSSQLAEAQVLLEATAGEVTRDPGRRRDLVNAGAVLEGEGRLTGALLAYEGVTRTRADDWSMARALLGQARICVGQGCAAEARAAIERLRMAFPDASESAEAGVIAARLEGAGVAEAERLLAQEREASAVYQQALEAKRAGALSDSVLLLEGVIRGYGQTPAALRSQEARAHVLLQLGRRHEALAAFQHIVTTAAPERGDSRVARVAKLRLATIHHKSGDRKAALPLYRELAALADSSTSAQTRIQAAALEMELLHRRVIAKKAIAAEEWERIQTLLTRAAAADEAIESERTRAGLLLVEVMHWQGRHTEAVQAAVSFLENSRHVERQDRAMAAFIAGESSFELQDYGQSIQYFRQLLRESAGADSIWERMDHVPRAYYRIWECLRLMNASADQIALASGELQARFPASAYTARVRTVEEMEPIR